MTSSVSLGAAFVAGLLSFLSPCVLPLIPAYLSFMTGLTTAELAGNERPTAKILTAAVLFVAGFSIVFVGLGASASVLGGFLDAYRDLITRVFGVLVIACGVLMLGVIRVPWLYGEMRPDMNRASSFGTWAALVMGMAFAAGWTPCVGPILGVILGLAGSYGSASAGALLLLAYSLGLGIPFIAVAALFGSARPLLRWLGRHSLVINRVAGSVLIAVGLLLVTGQFGFVASWLSSVLPKTSLG
ncbi:MAG: cytochrome c biogenesis protein CcdA [Coriobacteriales bacterium]|nr:cytochrome c biogenesis protein CcdA [Coriobacteriales bacterium]